MELPFLETPEAGWGEGDDPKSNWRCQLSLWADGARTPNQAIEAMLLHEAGGTVTIRERDGSVTEYALTRTPWNQGGSLVVWRNFDVCADHARSRTESRKLRSDVGEAMRVIEVFRRAHLNAKLPATVWDSASHRHVEVFEACGKV